MRILVIEDEKKVAKFIRRGLEENHYEVQTAADGEEGLRLASERIYDLIVLDWMLPKKDGLRVLKDLRMRKNTTPVLMLTGKDSIEDTVELLDSGSDDCLAKPFAFPELAARVRALVRRKGQERGAELRYADLRLDPVAHRVWRGDGELELTIREYRLLEYFVRNANQVLTRGVIAEHCWNNVFDTFTNIIDVYINYLRKKVDRVGARKLIHTVRGLGYILKEEE